MKCTNCGKNNAVYHYHFDLNGQEREAHLCPQCAGKLQPEREFAAASREVFGDMFEGGFFGGEPFGNMLRGFFGGGPFGGLFGGGAWSAFAMPGMPGIEISFPEPERGQSGRGKVQDENTRVDPELAKRRELNALRAQMKAAAESEDYEKAAELRDRIKTLEKGKKE